MKLNCIPISPASASESTSDPSATESSEIYYTPTIQDVEYAVITIQRFFRGHQARIRVQALQIRRLIAHAHTTPRVSQLEMRAQLRIIQRAPDRDPLARSSASTAVRQWWNMHLQECSRLRAEPEPLLQGLKPLYTGAPPNLEFLPDPELRTMAAGLLRVAATLRGDLGELRARGDMLEAEAAVLRARAEVVTLSLTRRLCAAPYLLKGLSRVGQVAPVDPRDGSGVVAVGDLSPLEDTSEDMPAIVF
eukprot:gnl/Dysnectes_brevis/7103_a11602_268.p1 GENE.gnl/Dysnectes_brevis/7103_a11602_268~~gnl/Dysnectes_brevis/7103_a11602_268.p1  ORF type:complete len:248 (+),score=67.35 gnl/Dysnectes_brevis/7103_a11602_268:126-869(+)